MFYILAFYLFITACLVQLCYGVWYAAVKSRQKERKYTTAKAVSIIICAKNEADNLRCFLPSILQQNYPQNLFEVIVVNDGSVDDTATILSDFQKENSNLSVVNIPADTLKSLPGKKYALAQGIKAASHDRLLLTDADCKPSSDHWLKEMTSTDADIVLGYGAYEIHDGLLNKFIRWETANTCMQYARYVSAGLTYMGVGRNLSYRKSLLAEMEDDTSFQQIYRNTPSGDDDLLIGRMAGNGSVSVCLDKNAHTISIPQKTWASWWKQKTRHVSTGKYYPAKIKNLLGLYGLSHSLYWFLGLPLVTYSISNFKFQISDGLVIFLFLLRISLYWLHAAKWYRRLNEKKLLLFYPIGDLGWALYNVFLSPYIFWKNRQAWK